MHRLTEAAGTKGVLRDPARREAYVVQLQLQQPAIEYATCGELWVKDAMEELRLRRGAEEAEAVQFAVVLAAVQQSGEALQFASEELKADREVVLAAVQQDGLALEHASEELRANREVVLAAVKQKGVCPSRMGGAPRPALCSWPIVCVFVTHRYSTVDVSRVQ